MRPLVYLHSAGGLRSTPVLEDLSRLRELHTPVFPGFDGTPADDAIRSRKALAHWTAKRIEKIGGPCDVMGSSFGGAVALWLALERPDLVDHLVLEAPAGPQTNDPRPRKDAPAFPPPPRLPPGDLAA